MIPTLIIIYAVFELRGEQMNNISKLEFISELSAISKQNNARHGICLFLGAGADVSSGGISFSELKKESVSFVRNKIIHSYESLEHIDKEFNSIIESLDEESRCMVIQRLIKNSDKWLPSDGYKLLILLAKENCVSSVITTNFSNLLETTQTLMGLDAFQIFTPATAIPAQYFMHSKPQKPVYLKMHGDLDGKLVTHLTTTEIQNKAYQQEFVNLFEYLIQNESIVFLGYSGWDTKIAEVFQKNIETIKNVYWCNIHKPDENAPLVKIFKKNNVNIKYINYNFDKVLQVIATELFKDKTLFHVDSIFIWALVRAKIQKLQTEFLNNIKSDSRKISTVRRTKLNIFDDFILDEHKNFCVITGNSGIGKSMLMAELCNLFETDRQIWMIPLNAMTTYTNDLLDYIVKKLGYASKDPYTVLYQFSRWAHEQDKYFIFIIDNLGNRIGTIKEIASLLNKLIELCYVIRNDCRVKFIITLRTDIWNNVFQLLDINYMDSIIWNEDKKNSNYAIRLGNFDEFELRQAKTNMLSISSHDYISDDMIELIREPSLYGLIQRNICILDDIDEINILTIFENTFFNGISKKILEKLSYSILCNYIEPYMPIKFSHKSIEYLQNNDVLKNILSIEEDNIDFKNDLVLECCLASYFNSNQYIDVFLQYSNQFNHDYLENHLPIAIYNGIIRYLGVGCSDFGKVVNLVCSLLDQSSKPSKFVTKFINDVFRYMAQYNTESYVNNIENFDTCYSEFLKLQTFFIYSAGFMKDFYAFRVLAYLRTVSSDSYTLECNALINDRFSNGLRKCSTLTQTTEYFRQNVDYILIPEKPLISLFFLLWVMGRIGKDNTNNNIYQHISALILNKIKSLECTLDDCNIIEVKDAFLKNAYFIFFNADNNLEEQYFSYPNKSKMLTIIDHVKNKKDLTLDELSIISSLVDHFDETIEFFVCNMVFVYMSVYSLDYALNNLNAFYATFNESTSVIELDFYSSALFLSNYIANPLDRQSYLKYYNRLVNDFEYKMFVSPSMNRVSTCRKFEDKFEVEFEDGFNILTDYTYTAPMDNYIEGSDKRPIESYLSTFWKLLNTLEQNGLYDEILQIIKAINQMSVNWPDEALEALSRFCKYNHPIIRKAVVRTLEENYLRYPNTTIQFLNQTGDAFSEDELLQIFSATNSQIENRTLEQLQWARIIYFIKTYINPQIINDLFEIITSSDTLLAVFRKIVKSLLKNDGKSDL